VINPVNKEYLGLRLSTCGGLPWSPLLGVGVFGNVS